MGGVLEVQGMNQLPTLEFNKRFKKQLLSGMKTRTTRMNAPNFVAGEEFLVGIGTSKGAISILFTARCDRIHNGPLSPIDGIDIAREGFVSASGFFEALREYYPDITGDSIVWAIEFRRVP
jgi:hypothetical protein